MLELAACVTILSTIVERMWTLIDSAINLLSPAGADTSELLEVNRHLTMSVASTGEYLSRRDELGHDLHFVLSGEIHILDMMGEPDIQLFEGSVVGEISIIFEIPVLQTYIIFLQCALSILQLSQH